MYEPTQLEIDVVEAIEKAEFELSDALKLIDDNPILWDKVEKKLVHARHAIQCALNEIKETE